MFLRGGGCECGQRSGLDFSQDVVSFQNEILLAIQAELGTGIFGEEHPVIHHLQCSPLKLTTDHRPQTANPHSYPIRVFVPYSWTAFVPYSWTARPATFLNLMPRGIRQKPFGAGVTWCYNIHICVSDKLVGLCLYTL